MPINLYWQKFTKRLKHQFEIGIDPPREYKFRTLQTDTPGIFTACVPLMGANIDLTPPHSPSIEELFELVISATARNRSLLPSYSTI